MTRLVSFMIALLVFLFVVELTRRERLTFKYAFGWIIVAVLGMFFSVFDQLLFRIAYGLGFELPSNFIFFALLTTFVFLSLLMTIFLCQQNSRNDAMAQKIGILELEIDQLKRKSKQSAEGDENV